MGLYDRFFVKARCPRCGKEEVFEFQTKVFDPALRTWKEGEDFVHPDIVIVEGKIKDCIAIHYNCPNPVVEDESYTSFCGDIIIKNGKVVGVENVREIEEGGEGI